MFGKHFLVENAGHWQKNIIFQDEGDNFITRCNKDLPNLPFPPPLPDPTDNPASPTTPCPGGGLTGWFGCLCLCLCLLSGFYFMITMKMNVKINVWRESQFLECTQCYSCGYKQNGTDGEMEEIIDTPFCNGKKNWVEKWCSESMKKCFSLKPSPFLFDIYNSYFIWFFKDFADGMANVVTCGKDDCCGSLKEYFIK